MKGRIVHRRIDVHQHVMPPFWREGMQDVRHNPKGYPTPPWTPESAVAFMDSQQIATGILSLTTPGVCYWPDDQRRTAARAANDYTAELAIRVPGRFGSFATLPLPDIDGALSEVAYALDTLKADGVTLFSNYDGVYLGDPCFEPLWAELDRRAAVVFVHPGILPLAELPGTPAAFVDFPFDTTRTATDIVLKGVFERHRQVKVILSHGGGFLPYQAYRIAGCASVMPDAPPLEHFLTAFRRFYFDTALASSPVALPSLKAFADPGHILFGSDYPYAPRTLAQDFTALLDASPHLDQAERAAIDHGNASALLPRWRMPSAGK